MALKKAGLKRRGKPAWNSGKRGIYSKETLKKIGLASSRRRHSNKVKQQIGKSIKKVFKKFGYLNLLSPKGKKNLQKVWFQKNHPTYWNEESKNLASVSHSGNKNHAWLGGKSFEPYSIKWTPELKEKVKQRDKFLCVICKNKGRHIHHIDYNKKNCKENNLVALCISCHMKTNFNRRKWIQKLKMIIKKLQGRQG